MPQKRLIIFGATGMLGSELAFYAAILARERGVQLRLVLHSSDMIRLQGLRAELRQSNFSTLEIDCTTSLEEAVASGGDIFFARSTRAKLQSRESMLLGNAPLAQELGRAIREVGREVQRVVCVSNPSDLMGLIIYKESGLPPEQVMSLSALDTMRYRCALWDRGIVADDPEMVLTLGSHDMQMAPMIDLVRVGGKPLREVIGAEKVAEIQKEVIYAGTTIYRQRGHTAWQSPASLSLDMLWADDQHPFLLPTARYHHSRRYPDTFISLPTRIDSSGCHHLEVELSEADQAALDAAYASIRGMQEILAKEGYL